MLKGKENGRNQSLLSKKQKTLGRVQEGLGAQQERMEKGAWIGFKQTNAALSCLDVGHRGYDKVSVWEGSVAQVLKPSRVRERESIVTMVLMCQAMCQALCVCHLIIFLLHTSRRIEELRKVN